MQKHIHHIPRTGPPRIYLAGFFLMTYFHGQEQNPLIVYCLGVNRQTQKLWKFYYGAYIFLTSWELLLKLSRLELAFFVWEGSRVGFLTSFLFYVRCRSRWLNKSFLTLFEIKIKTDRWIGNSRFVMFSWHHHP